MHPWPARKNNCCALTKPKCKQFMQENICLPHRWIDLSAPHSQPQAVVSLSHQHKIESQVLLPSYKLLHYQHQFFKGGLYRAINTMSFHSQDSIMAQNMTWLCHKIMMYSTQRVTVHTDISLYHTYTLHTHIHLPRGLLWPGPSSRSWQEAVFILHDKNSPCGPHIYIYIYICCRVLGHIFM